jgi:hypothetical protein
MTASKARSARVRVLCAAYATRAANRTMTPIVCVDAIDDVGMSPSTADGIDDVI